MKARSIQWLCRAGFVAVGAFASPAIPAFGSTPPTPAEWIELGRKLFFDPSLSASGVVSCSSCHSPAQAYGPPNSLAVQRGGPHRDRSGVRAVPSLRYTLNHTPVWSIEWESNPMEQLTDPDRVPTGGLAWDGRFDTLHDQAAFPLLSAYEMADLNPAGFTLRLAKSANAKDFKRLFGAASLNNSVLAFERAREALEHFELEDPSFHPYSSKFDRVLDGRDQFTAAERRGKDLFDDPASGNCASCHIDSPGADDSHPVFTDYQFEALGVPRNPEIPANADPKYFDLGLCGPLRRDQSSQTTYCGLFKTPSLRNVAIRGSLFHNGGFHDLKQALKFYVERDTNPAQWYPAHAGVTERFDDLPLEWRVNVDRIDAPLDRRKGDTPAWNDLQIDDVISFLNTLTDADVFPAARPASTH